MLQKLPLWAFSLSILGIIALTLGLLSYIFLPAWEIILGRAIAWWEVLLFLGVSGLLGTLQIPLGFRAAEKRIAVNLWGFFAAPATAYFLRPENPLQNTGLVQAMLWLLCVILYGLASRVEKEGVVIPVWTLFLTSGLVALGLHFFAPDLSLQALLWWGFVLQYASLLPPDMARAILQADQMDTRATMIAIGGAGNSDALWSAPTTALGCIYVAETWIW